MTSSQSSQPPRQNVEQKFRCDDLLTAHAAAVNAGARPAAVLLQRDVYFAVPHGRLKLRTILSESARRSELIAYERPDASTERVSTYRAVPVEEAEALEAALASALGVRAVVNKRRTLLMDGAVRLHLDEVEELGDFIEIEAVLGSDLNEDEARRRLAHWRGVFQVVDDVPESYVDLIERA